MTALTSPQHGLDQCEQDCDTEATTVVVTVNGWIIDVCDEHARQLCDPIGRP